MSINSVLFDLDGTLLQTADDLGAALNHVLDTHGLPQITAEHYTQQASNGSRGLLQLGFGDELKNHDFERLKSQLLQFYADNIAVHTNYFAEVAETLSFLNQRKIPWGIVTNKPQFLTTPLVSHFELLQNCHVVVSGDTVGIAKPDPKPMFHALKHLGTNAAQCLYVGDARRDIEAGKNAGMPTAAALWGYIEAHDHPHSWQADHLFGQINDLIPLFDDH
jgi:phosphoglycolate phosphatase